MPPLTTSGSQETRENFGRTLNTNMTPLPMRNRNQLSNTERPNSLRVDLILAI